MQLVYSRCCNAVGTVVNVMVVSRQGAWEAVLRGQLSSTCGVVGACYGNVAGSGRCKYKNKLRSCSFKRSWCFQILLYTTVILVLQVDALNFTAIYVLKRHLLYTPTILVNWPGALFTGQGLSMHDRVT